MSCNKELTHHGVKGMRWGVRKAGIASTQKRKPPFGAKTDGPPEKSARIARGKKYAKIALGTIGTAAAGTIAAAAITVTARRFIMYQFGKAVVDGLKG